MPKVYRLSKTPGDNAMDLDLRASVEMQKDKDPQSRKIDTEIKARGTSPSKEQSLDRHAIVDIINALKVLGADVASIKSFSEYIEYDSEMEKIKNECKTQELLNGGGQ